MIVQNGRVIVQNGNRAMRYDIKKIPPDYPKGITLFIVIDRNAVYPGATEKEICWSVMISTTEWVDVMWHDYRLTPTVVKVEDSSWLELFLCTGIIQSSVISILDKTYETSDKTSHTINYGILSNFTQH